MTDGGKGWITAIIVGLVIWLVIIKICIWLMGGN